MRRREFITLLGGATVAWPRGAWAQQSQRLPRIGVLINLAADDPEAQARIGAFLQGLQESGWAIGRNVRIDYRWAANADQFAADLVTLGPNVVLANANPSIQSLLR